MTNIPFNPFALAKRINRPLILDGAVGSLLQQRGVVSDSVLWSAKANIDSPEIVLLIHKDYIQAGADIITTNTFRTNPYSLKEAGISSTNQYIKNAVDLAKQAKEELPILIAGSNAPAEDCYQIKRIISVKELEWNHKEHIDKLIESGCDFILNETQSHFDEIKIICSYCSQNCIPFIISFFFDEKLKLLSGESLSAAIEFVTDYNPLAIAFNCIKIPTFKKAVNELTIDTVWGFYLNCGSGNYKDKDINCSISPLEYIEFVKSIQSISPSIIGACCGSNPLHIKQIKEMLDGNISS
jgi:homocysteine S-methyltransferase